MSWRMSARSDVEIDLPRRQAFDDAHGRPQRGHGHDLGGADGGDAGGGAVAPAKACRHCGSCTVRQREAIDRRRGITMETMVEGCADQIREMNDLDCVMAWALGNMDRITNIFPADAVGARHRQRGRSLRAAMPTLPVNDSRSVRRRLERHAG